MSTVYIAVASSADDERILAAGIFATRGAAEDAATHYWADGIGARHGYYAVPDDDVHGLPDAVARAWRALGAGTISAHTCERCDGSAERRTAAILAGYAPVARMARGSHPNHTAGACDRCTVPA